VAQLDPIQASDPIEDAIQCAASFLSSWSSERMTDGAEHPDFSVLENTGAASPRPSAFRRTQTGVAFAADWVADRIEDAATWLSTLVRYLPVRVARFFITLGVGLLALVKFAPSAARIARRDRTQVRSFVAGCSRRGAMRLVQFLLEVLDLLGTPEVFAFVWRILTRTSPLLGAEIEAAALVLGPGAVRFQDIRIAQGGVLRWIFARNGQRAFATFHTINLPEQGAHQRSRVDIVVHEIIHVYQYERAGSRYFSEALLGQHEAGYDYGGLQGLQAALSEGRTFRSFNREQQAQIAQDYYLAARSQGDVSVYEPFIRQLREGAL
jgi:hypothetical protein